MKKGQYNPEIHHRQSIRLKGHDYAGGGLYFVTICAHREFVQFAKGFPFGKGATCVSGKGATCVSPVREIIAEEWRKCGEIRDDVSPGVFVVMPDHFHGLIHIRKGKSELGHVIGAFKAAVSRRIRREKTHVALPEKTRIWHRNYYERIVRSAEAEEKITQYIRMNPWRCVQQFGFELRGMGNPALWNLEKLGICCSRNAPKPSGIPGAAVYFSGFHSPMEQKIFEKLLEIKRPIIWCPAWGIGAKKGATCVSGKGATCVSRKGATCVSPVLEALEENRILILEMKNSDGDLAAARERNMFVMQAADRLWFPYVSKGGMIDRLRRELGVSNDK